MKLNTETNFEDALMITCLIKVYLGAGIDSLYNWSKKDAVNSDYYYEFVMEAIECAAPIVKNDENLYKKYGYSIDDSEVYIWAYSTEIMQKYFKLARKLHRIEGNVAKENPYIKHIEDEIEDLRGFLSYNFDYSFGNKRKGAQLEVLWGYEFTCEIPMCLWIVRMMNLFKEELPKLQEKYKKARREKRANKSGGVFHAA